MVHRVIRHDGRHAPRLPGLGSRLSKLGTQQLPAVAARCVDGHLRVGPRLGARLAGEGRLVGGCAIIIDGMVLHAIGHETGKVAVALEQRQLVDAVHANCESC